MEKSLQEYTDPELSYLAVELIPKYELTIKETRVNVLDLLCELYDADIEVSAEARETMLNCLYAIADILEYKEQEEEKYTPPWIQLPK